MEQNLWLAAHRFSFWYWKLGGTVKKNTLLYIVQAKVLLFHLPLFYHLSTMCQSIFLVDREYQLGFRLTVSPFFKQFFLSLQPRWAQQNMAGNPNLWKVNKARVLLEKKSKCFLVANIDFVVVVLCHDCNTLEFAISLRIMRKQEQHFGQFWKNYLSEYFANLRF